MEEEARDEAGTRSGPYLRLEASVLEGARGREGARTVRPGFGGSLADNEMCAIIIVRETFLREPCEIARKSFDQPRERGRRGRHLRMDQPLSCER
jgi:hypothetical protein